MPEHTMNYGLIKPLDNETADIKVVNQNMDMIDNRMKQNADAVAAHLTDDVPHAGRTLILEIRADDPVTPAVGRIWLRSDL